MQFVKDKIEVLTKKLKSLSEQKLSPVEFEYVYVPEYKKENKPPQNADWKKYIPLTMLGGVDQHYWFRFNLPKVEKKDGKELRLYVRTGKEGQWDATNPQGIVYLNGKTTQGLDTNHYWVSLEYDKDYDVLIYYYTGMAKNCNCAIEIELVEADTQVEQLYYDLQVPLEVLDLLSQDNENYTKILNALNRTVLLLDLRHPYSEEFNASIDKAREYILKEFYEKECGKGNIIANCIGHTHIDVAWFWTVMQTKEKAQRSFSTVINMMKRFDNYNFMSSQPQLYQYVKENDPELYNEIKQRAKEGRWDVEGAMWLEPDINLSSGESWIRQIYRGKKFMSDEFGVESRIAWLPDIFGFSASFPQVLKKSGVDRFYTTKFIWNETNTMPHDIFMWKGIDGTEVFACLDFGNHFKVTPQMVYEGCCQAFKDKELTDNRLFIYGWCDGGGGPSVEQIEYKNRMEYGIPGLPKIVPTSTNEYFDKAEADFKKNTEELRDIPKWAGELYLELHRGTYTFMSESKRYNRKSEFGLMQAEGLSVWDMIINKEAYPKEKLDDAWSVILLNQFHDILPGSAIKEVYDTSYAEYEEATKNLNAITEDKINRIAQSINTEGGIFVYNPTSFEANGLVTVDGTDYYVENIPAHGWKVVKEDTNKDIKVSEKVLENDVIRVTFNDKYEIVSVYDKECGREVVEKGKTANNLCIYEDIPVLYDAWDVFEYYKQKKWIIDDVQSAELLDDGIKIRRKYGNSEFEQIIKLYRNSKRIDFITTADWHEDHVLLRAEFPVDINANVANYDIQFGYIDRPTHKNTSWDESKFEVWGHKWADLSEGDYGVSLLSDSKYGYNAYENLIGISLLKAATWPNPDPDSGLHKFTYSFYPHKSDFRCGGTQKEAYMLNQPLVGKKVEKQNGILPDSYSMISADKENVVIETVKKSEEGNDIIVRLYDSYNSKTKAEIKAGFDFKEVYLCDMMENNLQKLEVDGKNVKLDIRNFEVITLKFVI